MSIYFSTDEMKCKDGCGFLIQDYTLTNKLDDVRAKLGFPLAVTSWCRCKAHNKAVGGEPNSAHLRGTAVDITCDDNHKRMLLVAMLIAEGFKRIGIYKSWVHADVDEKNPQTVMWVG